MVHTAAERSPAARASLERAVLLTLVYSDLFDYPLTAAELGRFLPVRCGDDELTAAFDGLDGHVGRRDGYLFLAGRDAIVDLRRRRATLAGRRWRAARRFASWLRRVPFLRMVAVCGSQAVDNGDVDGDVDLFLITEPGRLWIVQSITMVLRRLGRLRFGVHICPNYLLTRERLTIDDRNLYTAREIAQAVPLWGDDEFQRFRDANRWIVRFLPRVEAGGEAAPAPERPGLVERVFGGRLGDVLDRVLYRVLLVYYQLRLRGRGWSRDDVERAYRPDRQALIADGFTGAVARSFLERAHEVVGASPDELRCFFYGDGDADERPDPHFAAIFAERYGGRP